MKNFLMSLGAASPAKRAIAQLCLLAATGSACAEALASMPGQQSAPPVPNVEGGLKAETARLDNGMQVVVVTNRTAPVVHHAVWYKVGSADEPYGQSGIAHFLEHLMFKSTKKLAAGQFDAIIGSSGGQHNAFTNYDYTGYYQEVHKSKLGLMMSLEADRMVNLEITEEQVASERDVILEERLSRTDSDPFSLALEAVSAALYRHHPYRVPIIGWRHEMEKLDRRMALDFYKLYYAPNNASLIVVGDVTMAEVLPLAQTHYGPTPSAPTPARIRPQEPPSRAPLRMSYADPAVPSDYLYRVYRLMASDYPGNDPEALELLASVLGDSATGRLHLSLVQRDRVALSAFAMLDDKQDAYELDVFVRPVPGMDLAKLEAALDAEIRAFLQQGLAEAESETMKRRFKDSSIIGVDSLSTVASMIGSAVTRGKTVAYVEEWPLRVDAVTKEQVLSLAAKALDPRASVTAYILKSAAPATAAPLNLRRPQ